MQNVIKTIDIDVPVSTVYNQWTQFETFPEFMEGVQHVRQLDQTHLRWQANVGGVEREWDAEISEQIPDKRIAWWSKDGAHNRGVVTFHYLEPGKSRVALQMDYEPEGLKESVGDALGFMDRKLTGDLERFKTFIEARKDATGAWRGSVESGQVVAPG